MKIFYWMDFNNLPWPDSNQLWLHRKMSPMTNRAKLKCFSWGTGTFTADIVNNDHPVTEGLKVKILNQLIYKSHQS